MGVFSSWIDRLVDKRVQAALNEREPKKAARRAMVPDYSGPSYEERIQNLLPRIFQRTPADFVPAARHGVYEGTGMDAAPEHVRSMADVYGIQPGMPEQVLGWYAAQSFISH